MSESNTGNPPILDQIIAQTLEALSQDTAFSQDAVELLSELAKSGHLVNFEQVVSALSTSEEQ